MSVLVRAAMFLSLAFLVVPVFGTASAATTLSSSILDPITTSSFANLTASAASSSEIDLSWTDPDPTVSTYEVNRSSDGIVWTTVGTTFSVGATTYADTGLAPSTSYTYQVEALTGDGSSRSSNIAIAITLSSTSTPTTTPTITALPTSTVTSTTTPTSTPTTTPTITALPTNTVTSTTTPTSTPVPTMTSTAMPTDTPPAPLSTPTTTAVPTVTSTGTTVPPTTGPFASGSIAYIGCSNTEMSVAGYNTISNTNKVFWPLYNTDSGTVDQWANTSSTFWTAFTQMYATYKGSMRAVWVNLCEQYARAPATYADVQSMFTILRTAAPGLTYYVSAINAYNPATLCGMMGPNGQGITDTNLWATQAVKDGLALPGPAMGPLGASTTLSDGCHPNSAGETLLGQQLADFFG